VAAVGDNQETGRRARLLAEFSTLATPAYRHLMLYDQDADAAGEDGLALPRPDQVVTGNGYLVFLASLQDLDKVRVAVHVWDARPDAVPGLWDGSAELTLTCATGVLLLREPTRDVPGIWRLPAPGEYGVRIGWRHRELMAERQQDLLDRYGSAGGVDHDGLARARERLGHPEEYRLDLWRTGDAGDAGDAEDAEDADDD
jgi:hypothetical protein